MGAFKQGDHIKVFCSGFTHHGIVASDGPKIEVIDLTSYSRCTPQLTPELASAASLPISCSVGLSLWMAATPSVAQAISKPVLKSIGKEALKQVLGSQPLGYQGGIGSAWDMMLKKIGLRKTESIVEIISGRVGEVLGEAIGHLLFGPAGGRIGRVVGRTACRAVVPMIIGKISAPACSANALVKAAANLATAALGLDLGATLAEEVSKAIWSGTVAGSLVSLESIASSVSHKLQCALRKKGATGCIRRCTLEDFQGSGKASLVRRPEDPVECLRRAESKLGHGVHYDLFTRNCEHFANWCIFGEGLSRQVAAGVVSMNAVPAGALCGVVGAGAAYATAAAAPTLLWSTTLGSAAAALGLVTAPISWPFVLGAGASSLVAGSVGGIFVGTGAAKLLDKKSTSYGDDFPSMVLDDEQVKELEDTG